MSAKHFSALYDLIKLSAEASGDDILSESDVDWPTDYNCASLDLTASLLSDIEKHQKANAIFYAGFSVEKRAVYDFLNEVFEGSLRYCFIED